MNLMILYQDNGQIEMEMNVITFGLLKQNTHEQWSMVNGGTHDKNRCSYYLCFLYYLNDLFWSIGMGNNMNNDKGNIGIITNERQIENLEEQTNILFKIGNKLEQRIATLEKVLQSHAKCIGELRGNE